MPLPPLLRAALLLGVLAALLAPSPLTASPQSPELAHLESPTHRVTIEYLDRGGAYRRGRITVRPRTPGVTFVGFGTLKEAYVQGRRAMGPRDAARFGRLGLSQTTPILSSGHSGQVVVVPGPRNLGVITLRDEAGATVSFRIHTQWNTPSKDDPPKDDPPKEEPPKEEPPEEEPPTEGDDCGPIPEGCEVYNPWTCECSSYRDDDAWSTEAEVDGQQVLFGI